MQDWKRLTTAGLRYTLAAITITAAAAVFATSYSSAQQPPGKSQPKGKGAPKGDPKQKGTPPAQPQGEQQPQLTYSNWVKVCQLPPGAGAKRVCFTGKDGKVETGMPVVAALLIEAEGDPRK